MKVYSSLLLLSLVFYSCSKEKSGTPEAIKELMAQNANCICDPYINQYLWRQQKVYVLAAKGPACDWQPAYYRENGEEFSMVAGYSLDDFLRESQLLKEVWACKN